MQLCDVIIIGSGPAGLTAGIYTARANLKTILFAGEKWGGQLMLTTEVENFPGFPEGIMGPELMLNMRKQAERFGVVIKDDNATEINLIDKTVNGIKARAIIIAAGAEFNWLGLPSEQRLIGKGVSGCATCDGAFFRNKRLIVVGGGDSAMEEALFLTKFASEVTIVHRRETFRASKIMQERVLNHPKIKTRFNTQIEKILGENKVSGVRFKDGQEMDVEGIFVAIGHLPMTKILSNQVEVDEKGYIKRYDGSRTSVEGVFVAGDVHDHKYRQAITAAGYGCEAALEAERWLTEQKA